MNPKKVALQISGWVNLPEEVISALLHPCHSNASTLQSLDLLVLRNGSSRVRIVGSPSG